MFQENFKNTYVFIFFLQINLLLVAVGYAQGPTPECKIDLEKIPLCPSKNIRILPKHYPAQFYFSSHMGVTDAIIQALDENSAMVLDIQAKKHIEDAKQGPGQVAITDNRGKEYREAPNGSLNNETGYARDGAVFSFDQESQTVQMNTFDDGSGDNEDIELCGVTVRRVDLGDTMRHDNESRGGNIIGFPGGGCLVGDRMNLDHARNLCGAGQPLIRVSTEGTRVNHVDENINIIPNLNRAAPCNFSVVMASAPAMNDILEEFPDEPYFGPSNIPMGFKFDGEDADTSIICDSINALNYAEAVESYHRQFNPTRNDVQQGSGRQSAIDFLGSLLLAKASAVVSLRGDRCADKPKPKGAGEWLYPGRAPDTHKEQCEADAVAKAFDYKELTPPKIDCKNIKNKDVLRVVKLDEGRITGIVDKIPQTTDSGVGVITNARIASQIEKALSYKRTQRRMAEVMKSNKSIIQANLPPSCNGEDMFIELPVAFSNSSNLNPNPANLTVVNKTAIIPQQINDRVAERIRESFAAVGLQTKEVNTLIAHRGGGNVHCLTNEIRICRP